VDDVLDLDQAAALIEKRRATWPAAGFDVGPLTWREAGTWPAKIVDDRDAVAEPDSVGIVLRHERAAADLTLFRGGWADVLLGRIDPPGELTADSPEGPDLAALENLLDDFWRLVHACVR
jgi:hypothetical protein